MYVCMYVYVKVCVYLCSAFCQWGGRSHTFSS